MGTRKSCPLTHCTRRKLATFASRKTFFLLNYGTTPHKILYVEGPRVMITQAGEKFINSSEKRGFDSLDNGPAREEEHSHACMHTDSLDLFVNTSGICDNVKRTFTPEDNVAARHRQFLSTLFNNTRRPSLPSEQSRKNDASETSDWRLSTSTAVSSHPQEVEDGLDKRLRPSESGRILALLKRTTLVKWRQPISTCLELFTPFIIVLFLIFPLRSTPPVSLNESPHCYLSSSKTPLF